MASTTSRKRNEDSSLPESPRKVSRNTELAVKIVSAHYGPCEGKRLMTGELSDDKNASIPLTRDVTPFLRALLKANALKTAISEDEDTDLGITDPTDPLYSDPSIVRLSTIVGMGGMKRTRISVFDGMRSMNAVFGDPCPGISKRLQIEYIVWERSGDNKGVMAASSETHYVAFAEHEKVILRRNQRLYQEEQGLKYAARRALERIEEDMAMLTTNDSDECDVDMATIELARKMGRSQSVTEFAEEAMARADLSPSRKWRLRSATAEVVVPLILPYLDIKERVNCQVVSRLWRILVQKKGIATTIDSNDPSFVSLTRPVIRGLLSHSHTSLKHIFLSGVGHLRKEDFHPSLPYLNSLATLDVSHCIDLDDSTLKLVSEHLNSTLEVLYIKGLEAVTDEGLIAVAQRCKRLKVLEISHIINITDDAAIAIGENLQDLTALYLRDNFELTDLGINAITTGCTFLEQLTVWGISKLRHLTFVGDESSIDPSRVIMLNLWGCFGLTDNVAEALVVMQNLHSLILAECHRISDTFVERIAVAMPRLQHLNLRYCKRLTGKATESISRHLVNVYSLDLSFCSRIPAEAIGSLLQCLGTSLAELKLRSCTNLDLLERGKLQNGQLRRGTDGARLLATMARIGPNLSLSVLDIRDCDGFFNSEEFFPSSDPFVEGLSALGFVQKVSGFFLRPASWNREIEKTLLERLLVLGEVESALSRSEE